ncbi:NAD(P)/FAD-dependent oxidoreductase [Conexibacter sp. DBS9H8]|uniref:phytoene desaturase family protein n=1 Tax=Conexibacter sp. DBS9H8 TaxID=2937801 RepID=UPI00200FBA16|nr:NAD(P)/FAD-dependent oxidoreductase [Conexibacter sp. DBS9H8]
MTSAAIVGSGPNGLAAALTLAAAGVSVTVYEAETRLGGGTRSAELTVPGLIHDECAAAHPLAVDNEFMRRFRLPIQWCWPEVQYSHPLDGDATDGPGGGAGASSSGALPRLFGARYPWDDMLQPVLHLPRRPVGLVRLGALSALPATTLARALPSRELRALWAGVAAHSFRPLSAPFSSAIGLVLGAAAHQFGWPVARGGSAAITHAMAAAAAGYGATFETGVRIGSLAELQADLILLDTSARAAVTIAGSAMPGRIAAALRRFRYGPAAFKVDFAVDGGVPWRHLPSRRAGTVHVGGSLEEIAAAEAAINAGRMPERPFVLVCQQSLADPTRARETLVPIYSYAHVPAGFTGDATGLIEAQIERFAPGFRERIVARHVRTVAQSEAMNANYVGGDIATGANDPRQLLLRPRPALDPYSLGIPGVYLCSAATPPGAGAHGMCGYNAAISALAWLTRR